MMSCCCRFTQVLLQTQQHSKTHHELLRSIINMGKHGVVGPNTIFTALHGMQSRYSDGNSVCPSVRLSVCLSVCLSVRLSNACIVTKQKKAMFRFLYHMKEHLS